MFGLITRAEHERILAAYIKAADAEIAAVRVELTRADKRAEQHRRTARVIGRALREKIEECDVLNENLGLVSTQLAKFTGPRERDAKGHFVSTRGAA